MRFSLVNEHEQQPAYFDAFEIVHKPNTEKLTVTSWTDYYPFGKVAKTACSGAGAYRYGYQGEFAEKDGETDWNSFELRQYDSEIGRFTTTDPMGKFWSSYVGMGNDPVNLTDPTGGETKDWYQSKSGAVIWQEGNAASFTASNGEVFTNIGANFQQVQNGVLYTYQQNEVVSVMELGVGAMMSGGLQSQINDFKGSYVPQDYTKLPKSTGAIEQSFPEEFFMPDVPLLWIAGKFGKAAVKYGVKMSGFGGKLTTAQLKAISSYEKLIAEHEAKLSEYLANPLKYDNKGHLKNAPNDAVREKIINARVHHLKHEIQTFKDNIDKILNE